MISAVLVEGDKYALCGAPAMCCSLGLLDKPEVLLVRGKNRSRFSDIPTTCHSTLCMRGCRPTCWVTSILMAKGLGVALGASLLGCSGDNDFGERAIALLDVDSVCMLVGCIDHTKQPLKFLDLLF